VIRLVSKIILLPVVAPSFRRLDVEGYIIYGRRIAYAR